MESDYHLPDKSTGTQTVPTTSTTTTQPPKGDSESTLSTSSPSSPNKPPELIDTDDSTEQICDPHIFNGKQHTLSLNPTTIKIIFLLKQTFQKFTKIHTFIFIFSFSFLFLFLISFSFFLKIDTDLSELTNSFRETLEEFRKEILKPNVLVVGTTGAGKSSLINTIFGEKVAQEGTGKPVTTHFNRYEPETLPVVIYDSKGLEHGNTAEFIESTKKFFAETQGDVRNMIHVVWYVVNGASSRVQPYEEEICKMLFNEIPVIFIINKGDISSDADRAVIRETLESFKLHNCHGIFDAVSGDRVPLLKIERCPACGSDDIEIRKIKQIVCCESCGKTSSMKVSRKDIITATLDILPSITREAFIFAQAYSCSHKDERAKEVIREHVTKFSGSCLGRDLFRVFMKTLVRLAILWKIQHYGLLVSHEIASIMLQRAFSVTGNPGHFIRKVAFGVAEDVNSTTAIAVIWNRCLRSIFIKVFMTFSKGENQVSPEEYNEIAESAFEDLNEDEHKAALSYLNEHGLEALLQREMPSKDPEIPTIPPPFVKFPSKESKHLLMGSPMQLPMVATAMSSGSVVTSPLSSLLSSASTSTSPSLNSPSGALPAVPKESFQEGIIPLKTTKSNSQSPQEGTDSGCVESSNGTPEKARTGESTKDEYKPKMNELLAGCEGIAYPGAATAAAGVVQKSQSPNISDIPSVVESPVFFNPPPLQIPPTLSEDTISTVLQGEDVAAFNEEITKEAEKEECELHEALHYTSKTKSITSILSSPSPVMSTTTK